MIKIIFCYNQVSYTIAREFDNKYGSFNIIIVDKNRVRTIDKMFNEIGYSRFIAFLILILSIFPIIFEIVIPHTNGGKILSLISRYANNLSYIDDGMDTFRESPKNIDLKALRLKLKYYTFNSKIPTANWLLKLDIIKLAELSSLMIDSRDFIDLSQYDRIVIDSPGVIIENFNFINTLFIIHPNKSKSSNFFKNSIKGNLIALEKSLHDYKGEIIVGESMVFIFLLNCLSDLSKITLCLKKSDYLNLKCLHSYLDLVGKVIVI
jgi:hypothetical protein